MFGRPWVRFPSPGDRYFSLSHDMINITSFTDFFIALKIYCLYFIFMTIFVVFNVSMLNKSMISCRPNVSKYIDEVAYERKYTLGFLFSPLASFM